jgi:outer membrane protein OmpA-like peptidoglycan-associated protein
MTKKFPEVLAALALPLVLPLFLAAAPAAGESFHFQYKGGEKYRLLTEVQEEVRIDGRLSHRAEILNKIAVETLQVRDGAGQLSCTFQTSERAFGAETTYAWAEDYESVFWRDDRGAYDIGARYFMPVVRDVPLFPEKEVQPGDTWTAPGEEAHDLRRSYGIREPVRFPIQVQYTYRGREQREGRQLEVIGIQYTVFHRFQGLGPGWGAVPVRVSGRSEQTYYWDAARGQPASYEESFDFAFDLSNGQKVEYVGTARGRLLKSAELDKEQVAEDIQRELAERGVEDTTVRAEEQGVTVILENIQFDPNSFELLPAEKAKLRAIGQILSKYADRDLAVSGHTAHAGNYTDRQHQELSELRARAVADYLLSIGAARASQLTSRGYGYSRPLADNATEEGRRTNRRVEITILEN